LISLSVDTDGLTGAGALLGKSVGDLQADIEIENGELSGTSLYVTGYTGFSGDVSEQSGNYLALHASSTVQGATLTAQLVGGIHGPVTLDGDGIVIFRLNENATAVKFTASKDGYTMNELTIPFGDEFTMQAQGG
jgi:hypothetical protein